MTFRFLFTLCFFFTVAYATAQYKQLSENAEISIITTGPGKVLYEGFGHSTIRIKDVDFDTAYNYGIFDFNAPNFYLNFTKGKLLYKLMSYPFHYFVRSYQQDKRWVREQVLRLNTEEKQQFFDYLENNALPENATYLYDPFFNNCASILRDISDIVLKDKVYFSDSHIPVKKSFRTLMNDQIAWNTWGSFGINVALGSKLDKIATEKQHMYLPDFVYSGFKNATVTHNGDIKPLVKKDQFILKFHEIKPPISVASPFTLFFVLLLIGLYITFRDFKRQERTKWLDFLLFFATGVFGVLIVFLWFFTNHSTTPTNFNFLWAFAPNIVVAFLLKKLLLKKWFQKYLLILLIFLAVIPIVWISKIQLFPFASIPFLLLLLLRFWYLRVFLLTFKK